MALTENGNGNGMIMPVAPMYGGYGYGNGNNGWGGDGGWWIILLFLFALGGWGNNGFNNGGFGGGANGIWPYFTAQNTDNTVQRGFDTSALSGQLNSIQSSISNGFATAEVAACNRAMNDQSLSFNNQIADLNRSFDAQTAITAGQTALQAQLAQCCCDNRLATTQLQNVVQQENCADREALSNGVRDIISAQTAGTQRILDKLCDQELQAERRTNDQLRQRLNMADLAASQAAQTAAIVADNTAQTQYLVNRIAPYPVPAVPFSGFYGWNNGWNNGCGCGCGNNFGGFNGNF